MWTLDYDYIYIFYAPLHFLFAYNHFFARSHGFRYSYPILTISKQIYMICKWYYIKIIRNTIKNMQVHIVIILFPSFNAVKNPL